MQTIINGITYVNKDDSDAVLIANIKDRVGQTVSLEYQKDIEKKYEVLSTRNATGTYNIPQDKEKVFINFIPQKTVVSDNILHAMLKPEFEYFVSEPIIPDEPFSLADGEIFRCASNVPKPKEDYQYYIVQNGKGVPIPNYKTLEVMLVERNLTLLSVRVLESKQCQEVIGASGNGGSSGNSQVPDSSTSWDPSYNDVTSIETLKNMQDNAKSADAVAESAKAEAQKQIDVVKKQAEAAKAEADAAKKQAEAEKAKADAAKAEADAEKEKAKQAQAEADAKKAEFEAQLGNT